MAERVVSADEARSSIHAGHRSRVHRRLFHLLRALLGLLLLLLVDLFGGLGLGFASSCLDLGALSGLPGLLLLFLILLSLFLSSNISFGIESGLQLHLLLLGCSLAFSHSSSVLSLFLCLG